MNFRRIHSGGSGRKELLFLLPGKAAEHKDLDQIWTEGANWNLSGAMRKSGLLYLSSADASTPDVSGQRAVFQPH